MPALWSGVMGVALAGGFKSPQGGPNEPPQSLLQQLR